MAKPLSKRNILRRTGMKTEHVDILKLLHKFGQKQTPVFWRNRMPTATVEMLLHRKYVSLVNNGEEVVIAPKGYQFLQRYNNAPDN